MPSVRSLLVVALAVAAVAAQETPPSFKSDTSAVMVDVVVRDKKGNPIVDLGRADFELFEDGVRQDIADLQVIAAGGTGSATIPQGAKTGNPTPRQIDSAPGLNPTFLALVFDRLSPDARSLAHDGALAYMDTTTPSDFAGVFVTDLSLVTIQGFTNNRTAIRAGIAAASTRATSVFNRSADRVMTRLGDPDPTVSPTASAEEHGPPDPATKEALRKMSDDIRGPSDLVFAKMAQRMERAYESLMRDEQGFATTNGLLAIVEALGLLPGRKTVVFFAEGLAIPPAVQVRFDSVVAAANRTNTTIYTVDAAGLRVHSKAAETGRQVRELGAAGVGDAARSSPIWLKDLEKNEDLLRQDPSASLTMLARRTGGFLIDNTNDLARGFREIDADRRFHYLLTYAPRKQGLDGAWRSLEVRVPGRKVQIRARSGYLAVRGMGGVPLLTYEGPALALFDRTPPPTDIPVRLGSFSFPAAAARSVVALLVDLEAQHVAFDVTDQGYRTDFTILALLRDTSGEVVRKGSFHYRLRGTPEQLDAARAGHVLFYRQPTVSGGRYALEVAVLDSFGMRSTVQRVPLVVPEAHDSAVSSLVVVRSTERVEAGELRDNPLVVGDLLAYPNLGEPVSLGAGPLTLLFSLRPNLHEVPSVRLDVLQDDISVGGGAVALGQPGEDGLVRQMLRIPVSALHTGECLVRLTVTLGDRRTVRTATVWLVD